MTHRKLNNLPWQASKLVLNLVAWQARSCSFLSVNQFDSALCRQKQISSQAQHCVCSLGEGVQVEGLAVGSAAQALHCSVAWLAVKPASSLE